MHGVTLGYIGLSVSDVAAWRRLALDVLGLLPARTLPGGGLSLRMDGHRERIFLIPGPDDLAFVGWQAPDAATLARLADRTGAVSDPELAQKRGVGALLRCEDPSGLPTELFCDPPLAATAFHAPLVPSGFVADDLGLGHLVLSSKDDAAMECFYCDSLGFRLSDRIACELHGHRVDLGFYHAPSSPGRPARHHTVAFGGRQRSRMHHFMLEVASLDDVGRAYDRAIAAGVRVMQTLGRHPNDRMLSFYAKTPSGTQLELGWGGRLVDDETWSVGTYDRISDWGHHPPAALAQKRPQP